MRDWDRAKEGVKVYTKPGVAVECFLYTNNDGKPCASAYTGKKNKPAFRFRYRTIEEALNKINAFIMSVEKRQEDKKLEKIEDQKRKKELFGKVEVGSIFVCSWGYEQTNVDAYQVVEKKGNSTVIIQGIGLKTVPGSTSSGMSCNVMPVKDSFLEDSKPFEKRVNGYGVSMNSYSSACLWDGKSDYYKSWYA